MPRKYSAVEANENVLMLHPEVIQLPNKPALNVADVCKILDVCPATVKQMIDRGEIFAISSGKNGRYIIPTARFAETMGITKAYRTEADFQAALAIERKRIKAEYQSRIVIAVQSAMDSVGDENERG